MQSIAAVIQAMNATLDLRRPAGQFLAQGQRHRIHQVGPACLDDFRQLLRAAVDGGLQVLERGAKLVLPGNGRRDLDGGRDDVVRALAEVDVVVGVHGLAQLARGQRCDDLVGIHVAGRTRPGLEQVDRELCVAITARDLPRCLADRFGDALGQQAESAVGLRRRGLDKAQRTQESARHAQPGNREVLQGALRLRAIQGGRGHAHFAKTVAFDSGLAGHGRLRVMQAPMIAPASRRERARRPV